MKTIRALLFVLVVFTASQSWIRPAAGAAPQQVYSIRSSIKLGGDGGWDYVTVDSEDHLLYVTRSTHTMVVDAESGKLVHDIQGMSRAHGTVLVPAVYRGFISDGKDGSVIIFDSKSGETLGKVPAAPDTDGIIYDPASNRVLVFCGDAGQMVAIAPDVDPKSGKAAAVVDLRGKPEFAVADGKGKVFVNIVDKDYLAVLDTQAMKVIARWSVAPGKSPTGLSMDPATGRLFIGCRNQKLIVMNADDGAVVADFRIGNGVDATIFDRGFASASCADGTLSVVQEITPDKFEAVQTIGTAKGARTMGVDTHTGTLYLPTADLTPPPAATADHPHPHPVPVPGTFRIIVALRTANDTH
jgi:DNA-binding beta-propeller fold protein YncE